MVHMVEGVVSAPVIAGCAALAVAGVGYGLTKLKADHMPKAAVVGAAFFVASLIHVPVGPSSAHLLLNGLMGLLLGWTALPALAVALVLQAAFFGFGGVTTLGVNLVLIGAPAIIVHHLFRDLVTRRGSGWAAGFGCGALAIGLSALGAAGRTGSVGRGLRSSGQTGGDRTPACYGRGRCRHGRRCLAARAGETRCLLAARSAFRAAP